MWPHLSVFPIQWEYQEQEVHWGWVDTRVKALVKIVNNASADSWDPLSLPTVILSVQYNHPNVGKAIPNQDLETLKKEEKM